MQLYGEDKEETVGSAGKEDTYQEEMTMAELLEQSFDPKPLIKGSIIKGTIVSIGHNELLINIGSKSEGVVRGRDLERVDPKYTKDLEVGDEIYVYILHLEDEDGYVELSLNKALVESDWERAQEVYESGESFQGTVVSTNKGGLIVNFGAVRGFVPGSQLSGEYAAKKANQWASLIKQELMLKIIEVDRRRNRLILSERAAAEEIRRERKKALLEELQEGEVRTGQVSSLADFGAFVDLGGAEGLIHLSELSWAQVSHPRDVLKVGDEVEVYVLSIDYERQRIGLSLKRLQPEPWSQVDDRYEVDQVVPAVITKLTSFGAFARIDNLLEGLIHISELSDRPVGHPREIVKEGEKVDVCIISIDSNRRRMGLSLKRVVEPEIEWVDADDDEETDESSPAVAQEERDDEPTAEADASDAEEETNPEAVVA